uniref:Uncharacterized protein n=1 Tax=Strombidium inclinatum TaxID=197538 RepID=A0A7S3N438_9SPIT
MLSKIWHFLLFKDLGELVLLTLLPVLKLLEVDLVGLAGSILDPILKPGLLHTKSLVGPVQVEVADVVALLNSKPSTLRLLDLALTVLHSLHGVTGSCRMEARER